MRNALAPAPQLTGHPSDLAETSGPCRRGVPPGTVDGKETGGARVPARSQSERTGRGRKELLRNYRLLDLQISLVLSSRTSSYCRQRGTVPKG